MKSHKRNLERITKKLYLELNILEKDFIPTCDVEELDQAELELKIDQLVSMIKTLKHVMNVLDKKN